MTTFALLAAAVFTLANAPASAAPLPAAPALVSATPASAPESAQDFKCFKCKGTGKLPAKVDPPSEPGILYDSAYIRSDPDHGVGFALCERGHPPVESAKREYEAKRSDNEAWLEPILHYEKVTGDKCCAAASQNVQVIIALPRAVVDRKRCNQAAAARRYVEFLGGRVYDRYREVFGIEDDERGPILQIIINKDQASFAKFMKDLTGGGGEGAGQLTRGNTLRYTTRKGSESDEDLEERIVYSSAPLFLCRYDRIAVAPPWLEIGFASWLERDIYGTNKNFLFTETPPPDGFKEGSGWRDRLKKDANSGDIVPLAELQAKDLNAYRYRDVAFAYSYVDFFIAHDPEKFRSLVKVLKRTKKTTLEAVQEIYGWLPAEVEDQWRDFVRTTY